MQELAAILCAAETAGWATHPGLDSMHAVMLPVQLPELVCSCLCSATCCHCSTLPALDRCTELLPLFTQIELHWQCTLSQQSA